MTVAVDRHPEQLMKVAELLLVMLMIRNVYNSTAAQLQGSLELAMSSRELSDAPSVWTSTCTCYCISIQTTCAPANSISAIATRDCTSTKLARSNSRISSLALARLLRHFGTRHIIYNCAAWEPSSV